jgi:lipopolysaccharide export system permease protein
LALAKARADLAIKEQVFVRDFPGLTIYVGQLPTADNESMSNVIINDRRSTFENTVIVARSGILDVDPSANLLLFRLHDGVIDRFYTDKKSVDSIFFDVYELKISPGPEFAGDTEGASSRRQDLPTVRLLSEAERRKAENLPFHHTYEMEFHRRCSLPLACLMMALIGMPLGASFRTKGRNFGLAVGLAIFIAYYSIFSLGWTFGEAGVMSPALALWLPVLATFLAAAWLLSGLNKTSPLDPKETLNRLGDFFRRLTPGGKAGGQEYPK